MGIVVLLLGCGRTGAAVRVFPAPAGAALSDRFTVAVDGRPSPAYRALVAPGDDKLRWRAMDDAAHSAEIFDVAAFSTFDVDGPATVTVTCPADVRSAKVLPTAAGVTATVSGRTVTVPLPGPADLTLEVDGDAVRSLHLFANPVETDAPRERDLNVIYFGPGMHDVGRTGVVAHSGQTVYLAGGAVLRATGAGGPVVTLAGNHVALRGRGVIDGTGAPTHSRSLVYVQGSDVTVEGVVLHDSAGWSMPVRRSDRVTISNVKLFSHRSNGDGIDLCNVRDATVDGCFARTLDDCVVVKSDLGQGPVRHVDVGHCVLWNQVAHALSVGAELREPVDDVVFHDCDVIHDVGREWTLRVYHCDAAPVTNVRFEHIRVEQGRRLISVWIGKAIWSKQAERGHVRGVTFDDITAAGSPLTVDLHGFDADHAVEDVRLDHVTLNGRALTTADVRTNGFVRGTTVLP
jgi:hypothetical protein